MKKIFLFLFLTDVVFAALSQVEYAPNYKQFRKYIAGSYYFGADTTTAKNDYGVMVSSDGFGEFKLLKLDRFGQTEQGIAFNMMDFGGSNRNLIDNTGKWLFSLEYGNMKVDNTGFELGDVALLSSSGFTL